MALFSSEKQTMHTLTKTFTLEKNLEYICEKCHSFSAHHPEPGPELMDAIRELRVLYDKKLLGDEAYRDLLRLVISTHIASEVSTRIGSKLETALRDKLSPHRLLETLV